MDRAVVVGSGQAGIQVADSLRAGGFAGAITVLGAEPDAPYQRPPLSKDFLAATGAPEPLPLRGARWFDECGIELRAGTTVRALDRDRGAVVLADGSAVAYTTLVLATGAEPRVPAVPGVDLAGVHVLRSLADARRLHRAIAAARSVVVVGAGFIGLEFAAVVRARGIAVTVLEAADRVLGRAVSSGVSEHIGASHRRSGTRLHLGEGLRAILGQDGRVRAVVGTGGATHPADLVLIGIGVRPRDELARAAGLPVDDGIVVDDRLRTADPAIHAVGDCARFPGRLPGSSLRLESVQNATDQGRHVARALLGDARPYTDLPWFWSNQGPVRLQIAGLGRPGDTALVTGEPGSGRFSVLRFAGRELVCVESVNRPADHMAARRLLAADALHLPTPEQAADPGFSLKQHLTQLAAAS